MSGMVLIINRKGNVLKKAHFTHCMEALSHRGPDGVKSWFHDNMAVGQQNFLLRSGDTQLLPLVDEKSGFFMVFDGSLDNREAICDKLAETDPNSSDASLVRQAYQYWGTDCFQYLKGCFTVIVGDLIKRCIYAFRSHLVGKSLFYYTSSEWFIAASEEVALLQHPAVSQRLNDAWIAQYFSKISESAETVFTDIKELMPGEFLVVDREKLNIRRLPPQIGEKPIRYSESTQYAEHFYELLSRAVSTAVRGLDKVGIMLSAGMDSAPLASIAARIPGMEGKVTAYSWSLPGFPTADETGLIRKCAEHIGIPVQFINSDAFFPLNQTENWPLSCNNPISNPFRSLKQALFARVQKDGCRALINGNYGDNLYPGRGDMILESLIDLKFELFIHELIWLLQHQGILGLFRNRLGEKLKQPLRRHHLRGHNSIHFTPFARQLVLEEPTWPPESEHHPHPYQYRALLGMGIARGVNGESQFINQYGIEWLEPFINWDLVDFMLSIPVYQCWRGDQTKFVARNAMRNVLPEEIRTRPRGGALNLFFDHGFVDQRWSWIMQRLNSPNADWPRFIDQTWMKRTVEKGRMTETEKMIIWQCLMYELWLDRYIRHPMH